MIPLWNAWRRRVHRLRPTDALAHGENTHTHTLLPRRTESNPRCEHFELQPVHFSNIEIIARAFIPWSENGTKFLCTATQPSEVTTCVEFFPMVQDRIGQVALLVCAQTLSTCHDWETFLSTVIVWRAAWLSRCDIPGTALSRNGTVLRCVPQFIPSTCTLLEQ